MVILIISFIRTYINNRRQICFNQMTSIYDRMELFAFENNLQNDKNIIAYLMPFKNYVVNTEFADIEILAGRITKIPKSVFETKKKKYLELKKSIPEELKVFSSEFDIELDKAIKLSILRASFLIYFTRIFLLALVFSAVSLSFQKVKNFIKSLKDIFIYENILITESFC